MKYKILIVDDEPANLRLLERLFRRSYGVITAASGVEGLRLLELHDVALIISDQRMPGMTGIEFLKKASEMRAKTVRIILTGYTDVNDLVDAINSGVVYKYITKPWVNEELRLTVVRGLEHYEAFKDRHDLAQHNTRLRQELAATRERFANLIFEAVRAKDQSVSERWSRIIDQARAVGHWLDYEDDSIKQLSLAATLSEIWRLSESDNSDDAVRKASAFWATLLEDIPGMDDVASAIRFQNANFDGNGVSEHISGERIPAYARILSIVSAFESLRFPKDGAAALTTAQANQTLRAAAGTRFDPALVEAFCVASAIGPVTPGIAGDRINNYSQEERLLML